MNLSLTFLLPFIILLLTANIVTRAYDQSLNDCKAVAAQFNNTCSHGDYDTPSASMDGMGYETVTCENKRRCIDKNSSTLLADGTTCTWKRKLCVTCSVGSNGVTKIRVQTNNLPNHCVNSITIKAKNFDYEVNFNSKQSYGEWVQTISMQNQLNNAVCPIRKNFDRASLGLVEHGDGESENVMGITINGVAFQFANQIREDPVYPITEANEQPLDICLGHNQLNSVSGMYHYHDISPCINPNFLDGKTMSECINNPVCNKSIVEWKILGYEDWKYKKVIGIAKDGHVLYGPFDDSGQLWQTDNVDICNGAWSENNDDYFYVGTQWHPYSAGCFGPYNFPQNNGLYAQCSTNGMDQYINNNSEGGGGETTLSSSTGGMNQKSSDDNSNIDDNSEGGVSETTLSSSNIDDNSEGGVSETTLSSPTNGMDQKSSDDNFEGRGSETTLPSLLWTITLLWVMPTIE